jgi:hypothetical protein
MERTFDWDREKLGLPPQQGRPIRRTVSIGSHGLHAAHTQS